MGLIGKRNLPPGRPYLHRITKKFYDLFQPEDLSEIVQGLSLGGGEEIETAGDTVLADGSVQEKIDTGDTDGRVRIDGEAERYRREFDPQSSPIESTCP